MCRLAIRFGTIAVLALAIAAMMPVGALAYKTFGGHNLKYGVGDYGASNQYYYITANAVNYGYTTSIKDAMSDWIYTTSRLGITTPISYARTTTQSSSRMDIYYGNYYDDSLGIYGATSMYHGSTCVGSPETGAPTVDWVWGKIKLNNPNFSAMSSVERKGVIAHEMGHVMGLAHVSDSAALMYTYEGGPNDARKDDLNGINYLY